MVASVWVARVRRAPIPTVEDHDGPADDGGDLAGPGGVEGRAAGTHQRGVDVPVAVAGAGRDSRAVATRPGDNRVLGKGPPQGEHPNGHNGRDHSDSQNRTLRCHSVFLARQAIAQTQPLHPCPAALSVTTYSEPPRSLGPNRPESGRVADFFSSAGLTASGAVRPVGFVGVKTLRITTHEQETGATPNPGVPPGCGSRSWRARRGCRSTPCASTRSSGCCRRPSGKVASPGTRPSTCPGWTG